MYKAHIKLVIAISLLLSDFLTVYSEIIPGAKTENVVVTVKNYFKPEELTAALNKDNNQSEHAKDTVTQTPRFNFARTARAKKSSSIELFTCAVSLDASCLVDHVEDIVDNANNNLLQQADAEARKIAVGRADSEEETAPSTLIASIAQMLLELPEALKDGLGGMFRSGSSGLELEQSTESDSEEEDEDEEEEEEENDGEETEVEDEEEDEKEDESKDDEDKTKLEPKEYEDIDEYGRKKCGKKKGCSYGMGSYFSDDGRGKKKKKKKAIVKLLLLGLIIKAKITLLLKLLAAKLQVKFLLIALANLLLNLARFWWDLKKGSHHEQPQKVIYYEHAQHQHHYDGGDEWQSSPGGGGGYWGRAYESEDTSDRSAQDIAYAKQLPKGTTYTKIDDKPNISWNPFG